MKKFFKFTAIMALAICLVGCGNSGDSDTDTSSNNETNTEDLLSGNHHIEIDVQNFFPGTWEKMSIEQQIEIRKRFENLKKRQKMKGRCGQ